jgi:hypothetical protein
MQVILCFPSAQPQTRPLCTAQDWVYMIGPSHPPLNSIHTLTTRRVLEITRDLPITMSNYPYPRDPYDPAEVNGPPFPHPVPIYSSSHPSNPYSRPPVSRRHLDEPYSHQYEPYANPAEPAGLLPGGSYHHPVPPADPNKGNVQELNNLLMRADGNVNNVLEYVCSSPLDAPPPSSSPRSLGILIFLEG